MTAALPVTVWGEMVLVVEVLMPTGRVRVRPGTVAVVETSVTAAAAATRAAVVRRVELCILVVGRV